MAEASARQQKTETLADSTMAAAAGAPQRAPRIDASTYLQGKNIVKTTSEITAGGDQGGD
jgi:hypothetical protein